MLDFVSLALVSIVSTSPWTKSVVSESRFWVEDSTPAMILVAGMCLGVTTKHRHFINSVVSSLVRFLSERFITQLMVSNWSVRSFSCGCSVL